MAKGKKKSKSKKNAASKEAPPAEAGKEPQKEEPPKEDPKKDPPKEDKKEPAKEETKKEGKGTWHEEKARKIEKNKNAIEAIIGMLRSIPPDNISSETRDDLIKIHHLAKGIWQRYQGLEKKDGGGKQGENAKDGSAPAEAAPAAPAEFKLDGMKPAFADIFTVCDPDA